VIEPIWGAVLVVVASCLAVAVVILRCKSFFAIINKISPLTPKGGIESVVIVYFQNLFKRE